jgi:hypothetical protein
MYLVETKEGHPVNELQKQKEQIRSLEERLARVEAALEGTAVTHPLWPTRVPLSGPSVIN